MSKSKMTSEPGYRNRNNQEVIRNTGSQGTDHLQYIYEVACRNCGHRYGSNGSDIHERKCPRCQKGKPGFDIGGTDPNIAWTREWRNSFQTATSTAVV